MIFVLQDEETFRKYDTTEERLFLYRHGGRFGVQRIKERYCFRYPHEYCETEYIENTHGALVRLTHTQTGTECILSVCREDDCRMHGKFISEGNLISFGSSMDDDLFLEDTRLGKHAFQIRLSERTIHWNGEGIAGFLNGKSIRETRFRNGDKLEWMNVTIVLHEEFVTIFGPGYLYTVNSVYQPNPLPSVKDHTSKICYSEELYWSFIPEEKQFTITGQEHIPQPVQRSFLLTVGPAVTISMGSLLTASFSIYRSYLDGHEIYESLPLLILPAFMMLGSVIWNGAGMFYEKRKYQNRIADSNRSYLEKQKEIRKAWEENIQAIIREERKRFPDMEEIIGRIRSGILYPVLPADPMYGCFEIGMSDCQRSPVLNHSEENKILPEISSPYSGTEPLLVSLRRYPRVCLKGEKAEEVLKYIVLQIAVLYSPKDFHLYILLSSHPHWMERLPHVQGIHLRIASNAAEERIVIREAENERDCFRLVVTDHRITKSVFDSEIEIHCDSLDYRNDLVVHCHNGWGEYMDFPNNKRFRFEMSPYPDFDPEELCCVFPENVCAIQKQTYSFFDVHDLFAATDLLISKRWEENREKQELMALVGVNESGDPIALDLHEKGNGPHGLVAGMTGSGKSEWILSFLLSLAISYSPHEVQFVLVDFKGGGVAQSFTIKGLELPHLAGVLTNLAVDDVERALVSFRRECLYREKLFRKASELSGQSVGNIDQYRKLNSEVFHIPYMPHLVIVIDEFAELKSSHPEFMQDLISLSRIGRSLGLHLILSTQKPAGIVNDEIRANTRFHICLKVQSRQDSVDVVGMDAASEIRNPGDFWFQCDRHLTYGHSGYAGDNSAVSTFTTNVFRENGDRICLKEEGEMQLMAVLKQIVSVKIPYTVRPLWLPPLLNVSFKDMQNYPGCYAVADDYYNQTYAGKKIHSVNLFLGDGIKTIHDGCAACSFAVLMQKTSDDEMYLITEHSKNEDRDIYNGIVESDDKPRLRFLDRRIHEHRNGKKYLFLENVCGNGYVQEYVSRWIKDAEVLDVSLFIFCTPGAELPYRLQSGISERAVLQNDNPQKISEFLGMSYKSPYKRQNRALSVMDNHIVEIVLPTGFENMIQKLCKESAHKERYLLPNLPNYIRLSNCDAEGTPIGIGLDTFQWITAIQSIVFVTNDPDSAEIIRTVYCESSRKNFYLLLEPSEYFGHEESYADRQAYFVGPGYAEEYRIHGRKRVKLKVNEGICINGKKSEVIRLAEGE